MGRPAVVLDMIVNSVRAAGEVRPHARVFRVLRMSDPDKSRSTYFTTNWWMPLKGEIAAAAHGGRGRPDLRERDRVELAQHMRINTR